METAGGNSSETEKAIKLHLLLHSSQFCVERWQNESSGKSFNSPRTLLSKSSPASGLYQLSRKMMRSFVRLGENRRGENQSESFNSSGRAYEADGGTLN